MDLKTKYMGLNLKNPLVISACPMTRDLNLVKVMQEEGASAIVLPSLFEEEITYDQNALDHFLSATTGVFSEAMDYFPEPQKYQNVQAEEYLDSLNLIKKQLSIPVIASLNGITVGGWNAYAKKMQDAGADALELNIFWIPTDENLTAEQVEDRYIQILKEVKSQVTIPVAVKMSPFFSSISNMAKKFEMAGADGLVLFNRFLEPDINLETREVAPKLELSSPYEMRLTLHWTAILRDKVRCSLGATRGIKTAEHLIKLIMAGADVGMIASVLYQSGVDSISKILIDLERWMTDHEYESITQMKGSMSYKKVPDPSAFERANYMKMLRSIL